MAGPITENDRARGLLTRAHYLIQQNTPGGKVPPDTDPLVIDVVGALRNGIDESAISAQLQAVSRNRDAAAANTPTPYSIANAPSTPRPNPGSPPVPGQPVDPQVVLGQVLQSISANAPKPADFTKNGQVDANAYANALATWSQMLTSTADTAKSLNALSAGVIDVGGGRYITQAQFDALGPQEQAQVAAVYRQKNAATMNQYNQLMNSLGLEQYRAGNEATAQNNSALSAQFQNKVAAVNQQIALGNADVSRAAQDVSRSISGLGESRSRADAITKAQEANAPRVIDPSQLPAYNEAASTALGNIARYAGSPNLPQFKPFGAQTIDVAGLMKQGDQELGVTGPLPTIPNPFANIKPMTVGDVPVPTLAGAPPQAIPYIQVPQLPIPSATPQAPRFDPYQ